MLIDGNSRYETWHGFADGIQEGRCAFGSGNFDADSVCLLLQHHGTPCYLMQPARLKSSALSHN